MHSFFRARLCTSALLALLFTALSTAQTTPNSALSDAAPAQRIVDDGTIIENVTLISPERAGEVPSPW